MSCKMYIFAAVTTAAAVRQVPVVWCGCPPTQPISHPALRAQPPKAKTPTTMKKMMLMAFAAMFTLSLCAQTPVRKCDKKCDKKEQCDKKCDKKDDKKDGKKCEKKCDKKCEKKCDKKCDGQKCGEKK